MKHSVMLTIASLLSILFFTFHLADDIVRGIEPGTFTNLTAVPIFVLWLYGTLVLAERRSGYIITLLRRALFVGRPHRPHEGEGYRHRQQPRPFERTFLFRLDVVRDWSDRALFRHSRGARTVEPAMAPVPVVQQPEPLLLG